MAGRVLPLHLLDMETNRSHKSFSSRSRNDRNSEIGKNANIRKKKARSTNHTPKCHYRKKRNSSFLSQIAVEGVHSTNPLTLVAVEDIEEKVERKGERGFWADEPHKSLAIPASFGIPRTNRAKAIKSRRNCRGRLGFRRDE